MNKAPFSDLGVKLAGVALLLLPFFISPNAASQDAQLQGAKLIGVFLVGNFCFSLLLFREIHWIIGFVHLGLTFLVWWTGLGSMQLFPFAFWSAALLFSLWFVRLPACSRTLLWKMLLLGAGLSALHGLIQALGMENSIRDFITDRLPSLNPYFIHYAKGADQHLPIAYFGQHTKFGAFIALMVPVAVSFNCWPLVMLFGLVLGLTGSSFSIAAGAAGALMCLRWELPKGEKIVAALAGGLFLFALLGVVLFQNFAFFFPHGRFGVWKEALLAWWNGPYFWTGYGLGSFGQPEHPSTVVQNGVQYLVRESFFSKHFESATSRQYGNFAQAHNDYIQVLFEMGVLGGVLMMTSLLAFLRSLWRIWWKGRNRPHREIIAAQGALCAILVNAAGNFPFQLAPHFFIAVLCFVILLKETKEAATIYAWPPQTSLPSRT